MAVVFGQRLPNFTKETATKIRTNQSFDHIYANVACKVKACLANQRFQENDATPAGLEVGASAPSCPQTAKDYFRRVYYEAIHLIVRAIYQLLRPDGDPLR